MIDPSFQFITLPMIGAAGGDSGGMSEIDKTSQPRALAMGDGLSLTPRKSVRRKRKSAIYLYNSYHNVNIKTFRGTKVCINGKI